VLTNQKKVSIIIRTKNEERWIGACLRSVYSQNYKNIEVILVDNESTDKTVDKAQEFPVKVVNITNFLPGKSINDGIRASSGEYLVCLSGHCVPVNSDWLGNLVQDLDKDNIAGVYGRQEPLSFTSDLDKRDLMMVFGKDKKVQVKDSFFHNANSAFRRDIWDKHPFDEQVTNIEDRVWGEQIIAQNLNIIYEPNASVYHWHGIHQDLSPERAKSIVKILEGMEGLKSEGVHQKPEDMKILAVIPSKGKTLYMNDKPLIERTISTALQSKFITDIVVATDNTKTALIAKNLGAKVPFIRPKRLSEDYIDIFDVVGYTVEFLEQKKKNYNLIVLLEEVYPFRSKDMIDKMIEDIVFNGHDTVVAGVTENRSVWTMGSKIELLDKQEGVSMPSALKESKKIISMAGLCCVAHVTALRNNSVFSGDVSFFEVDDILSSISTKNDREMELASILEKGLMNEG
jgi:rhamnosyltransferase